MASGGDSRIPHTRLGLPSPPEGGNRPTLPPISPAAHQSTSPAAHQSTNPAALQSTSPAAARSGSSSAEDVVDAAAGRRSRGSAGSISGASASAGGGGGESPTGGGVKRTPSRSSRSPRAGGGGGGGGGSPPRPHSARRPSSIIASRRPSVTPSRRTSVAASRRGSTFSTTGGLQRTGSGHRPWEPREPREPRPWSPRASVTAELTPDAEAALERELGRECQILWCSRTMHVWYALVIVLPMLVALGVGIWARYEWLQATASAVLAVYVLVYVIGLLNLFICGRDCRHEAIKTRSAAYCEALLTAIVPVAIMIALIVYISVEAE